MYNKQRTFLFLCLSFLASCCCQDNLSPTINPVQDTAKAAQYFEDEMNFNTTPLGVKWAILEKTPNITIVDVRAEKDYAKGHIPGAINIPYDKWNGFEGKETEFSGLRKDGFNYVYCYELLCNLSQKAAKKFATLGYPSKEMKGGFDSWKSHRFPIQR